MLWTFIHLLDEDIALGHIPLPEVGEHGRQLLWRQPELRVVRQTGPQVCLLLLSFGGRLEECLQGGTVMESRQGSRSAGTLTHADL